MAFEDDFPNLKDLKDNFTYNEDAYVIQDMIKENCLDKVRVREAFEKAIIIAKNSEDENTLFILHLLKHDLYIKEK